MDNEYKNDYDGTPKKRKGREGERFWNLILSVGSHKIPKIDTKHCLHKHSKSVHRMVFCNKRLVEIAEKYLGVGSINKEIPPIFLELPKNLLEVFLNGLLDGDGSNRDGLYKLTSISQKLVMSLNLAIMKVYGVVGNITKTIRLKTTTIEGRVVNQKDTYTIGFTKEVRKQKHYHETEKFFLAPIKSVKNTGVIEEVYNIEVATDNSYTANNAVVHNCQAWSIAGKGLGDKDERGMLFWTTLDIIKKVLSNNPNAKFMLENVKMKKEFEEYITYHTTEALGEVHKTLINSALVSAQNRNRYYWTNFEVSQPKDKGLVLSDIIIDKESDKFVEDTVRNLRHERKHNQKSLTCTATMYKGAGNNGMSLIRRVAQKDNKLSVLTVHEAELLQTIPIDFTKGISNTQRYKAIGNGWTTDVIAHIFNCAFNEASHSQ